MFGICASPAFFEPEIYGDWASMDEKGVAVSGVLDGLLTKLREAGRSLGYFLGIGNGSWKKRQTLKSEGLSEMKKISSLSSTVYNLRTTPARPRWGQQPPPRVEHPKGWTKMVSFHHTGRMILVPHFEWLRGPVAARSATGPVIYQEKK